MRYYTEKPLFLTNIYGSIYICDHELYDKCTLFEYKGRGIAVIQQKIDRKMTYWSNVEPWLADRIYLHKNFYEFFVKNAAKPLDKLYPTYTVRQIMHELRMKPIRREKWETYFDRKPL